MRSAARVLHHRVRLHQERPRRRQRHEEPGLGVALTRDGEETEKKIQRAQLLPEDGKRV